MKYIMTDRSLLYGICLGGIDLAALVSETNNKWSMWRDDRLMGIVASCSNKPANRLAHNVVWQEVDRV